MILLLLSLVVAICCERRICNSEDLPIYASDVTELQELQNNERRNSLQDLARCVSLFRFLRKNRSKTYKKRLLTQYCTVIGLCVGVFWMPVLLFVLSQSLPNQHSHKQMQTIWLQPILLMVPLIQPWACVEMLKRLHLRTTVLIKYLSTASVVIKQFDFEGKQHRMTKMKCEANSESISLISVEQGMDIYELDRQIESSRQFQNTSEEIRQNTIKAINQHSLKSATSLQELAGLSTKKIAEFIFETTI